VTEDSAPAEALAPPAWPSVDTAEPVEEGGPSARKGFNYQDEIGVGVLLEMLKDANILRVHCETHDDLVIVHGAPDHENAIAEFVQVKALERDQLWSIANLCERKKQKAGTSLFETSLNRDRHCETSRFRIVTLRPVNSDLAVLSHPLGTEARSSQSESLDNLVSDLNARFPDFKSTKGNDARYWLENCEWHQRYSEDAVREHNLRLLVELISAEGRPLLVVEQLDTLLVELRIWVKAAGDARWSVDRRKKIISREQAHSWWERRYRELVEGASSPGGGKLADKMRRAGLPDDLIGLAIDLRRSYAAVSRTSRYLAPDDGERLQNRVKSTALSLSTRLAAGILDLDGPGFHALCVEQMDELDASLPGPDDHSAYLKGCLYDIADRCLLRFDRNET
jgi:hypothetical protein